MGPGAHVFGYGKLRRVVVWPGAEVRAPLDNAVVTLKFANGAVGGVDLSRNAVYGYDIRTEVVGSEGSGLRRLTRERCDAVVRIPMHGVVDSLNVATAAAVCLYEARRQRGT